jgi:hypothetical protein
MNSSDYYERLDLDYDEERLIEESLMVHYDPFQTGKNTDSWFDNQKTWLLGRVNDSRLTPETHRLKKMIETLTDSKDVRPRYYVQKKGSSVPFHRDMNTECSLNIILSNRAGPILFEDIGEVVYRCALLNTTQRHGVPKFKTERLLLKFSIFDKTYDETREGLREFIL